MIVLGKRCEEVPAPYGLVDPCLRWPGPFQSRGYGMLAYKTTEGKNTTTTVHRRVYTDAHGPLLRHIEVRHHCDNPWCVQLSHLEEGTAKQNQADRRSRGRHGRMKRVLDAPKAREIYLAARSHSTTQAAIASNYDVHITTVQYILAGKRWAKATADLRA
jgi:hypothetical protein